MTPRPGGGSTDAQSHDAQWVQDPGARGSRFGHHGRRLTEQVEAAAAQAEASDAALAEAEQRGASQTS